MARGLGGLLGLMRGVTFRTNPAQRVLAIASTVAVYEAGPAYTFADDSRTAASADGGVVASWTDRKNAAHAAQTVNANRPLLASLGGGKWAVVSDGSNDSMTAAGVLAASFPSAGCVFVRADMQNNTTNTGQLVSTRSNDGYWAFQQGGQAYPGVFRTARLEGDPATGVPVTGWHTYEQQSSASAYLYVVDGVTLNSNTAANFNAGLASGLKLFCNYEGSGFGAHKIAGIVVTNAVPAAADLATIRSYLAGLTP